MIKGEINENDIKETDILSNSNKDSKGYIHIGSIVLEKYPTLFSNKNLFLIIAGVIDRVIELQTKIKIYIQLLLLHMKILQETNISWIYTVYGWKLENKDSIHIHD